MARKKKASPAQLAARAKFATMAKARALKRRGKKAVKRVARKTRAAAKAFRATNPRHGFQIAVLRLGQVRFLAGVGLSSNRDTAAFYGTLQAARKSGNQIRQFVGRAGIQKVAVVTTSDSLGAIKAFLTGKA